MTSSCFHISTPRVTSCLCNASGIETCRGVGRPSMPSHCITDVFGNHDTNIR
jgi:hypothetical protein